MKRLLNLIKWAATMGRGPQTFLGARWIHSVLKVVPKSRKRLWALRILSLSPHYFINQNEIGVRETVGSAFLEKMSGILTESRQSVFDRLLKRHLEPSFAVIDYGCGPGYLAFAAGQYVRKVYGIDVSAGALECAGIVNHRENIHYLMADEKGFDSVPDQQIDAVYSFAVIQHMTNDAFDHMLSVCQKKLRPGGRLLLHIQLPTTTWQTQADWEKNRSLEGQVKYKYGLHCFGRTESEYRNFLEKHGFGQVTFSPIAELFPESQDDLTSQRLLIAFK